MEQRKHSFSSRLSLKTIVPTSILFFFSILLVSIFSSLIFEDRAIRYAQQCLASTGIEVGSVLSESEKISNAIAITAEEYYNSGKILDTAQCFSLLERTVQDNPYILGCGFYFAPDKYVKGRNHIGIYANTETPGQNILHEWDSDSTTLADGWDYFEEDFYREAAEGMKPVWLSPILTRMVNEEYMLLVTYSFPMTDANGDFIGVFATDLSLDWLYDKLVSVRPYEHSNVVLADSAMNVICNPLSDHPYEGSLHDTPFIYGMDYNLADSSAKISRVSSTGESDIQRIRDKKGHAFIVSGKMRNGWNLLIASLYKDVFIDLIRMWTLFPFILLVALAMLFMFNRRIINKLARPIREFAVSARKITRGRFDVSIPEVDTNDELMELSNAMKYMQNSVTSYIQELETTTAEKERLRGELNVAHSIQTQMLYKHFPTLDKGGIYAVSIPAKEVGGDLYDYIQYSDELYFIVGDVSGKGVPAALLMAITIAAFRATGKKGLSPETIVSHINNTFCSSNTDMMFVTLVIGKINLKKRELTLCNAGHNPILLTNADGKAEFFNAKTNIACGIMADFPYQTDVITLHEGSRLIIYSDGITEAEDKDKAQYGEQRLKDWAKQYGYAIKEDRAAIENLTDSVRKFTGAAEQNDDITAMSITV